MNLDNFRYSILKNIENEGYGLRPNNMQFHMFWVSGNNFVVRAKANESDQVISVELESDVDRGIFAGNKKKKQIEEHIRIYMCVLDAMINLSSFERQKALENIRKGIVFNGYGIAGTQKETKNGLLGRDLSRIFSSSRHIFISSPLVGTRKCRRPS